MRPSVENFDMAPDTGRQSRRRAVRAPTRPSVTRVEHFTPAERAARGKATRDEAPRTRTASWEPACHRPDPVELLEEQAQSRVPELVPIRYGRMLVSPFTFYRGGAYIMASDLAGGPGTGLHTQLCGDAHLSNFGGFAAPDRKLVFSLNDFDETLPGPFEWDLKRLVASFAVAGRDRGFDEAQRERSTGRSALLPRELSGFAAMRNLDIWYSRIDIDDRRRVRAEVSRQGREGREAARRERRERAHQRQHEGVREADEVVDGERRITARPAADRSDRGHRGGQSTAREFLQGVIRYYRRTLAGDRRKLLERSATCMLPARSSVSAASGPERLSA